MGLAVGVAVGVGAAVAIAMPDISIIASKLTARILSFNQTTVFRNCFPLSIGWLVKKLSQVVNFCLFFGVVNLAAVA